MTSSRRFSLIASCQRRIPPRQAGTVRARAARVARDATGSSGDGCIPAAEAGGRARRRVRWRACSSSSASARFRAIRRPRSPARTATRRRSRRSGTSTCSTGRCPCSTCAGSRSVVQGDLGVDRSQIPIGHTIVHRLPLTLELAFAQPAARDPDRRAGGGDRGGAARRSDGPRRAVRGADRAVGAALLARAAADHLVRGRPELAAGDRLRLDAASDREPRAHGACRSSCSAPASPRC